MKANTAIVILNYKNYPDTVNCINSILTTKNEGYVIIVVDNASKNNSLLEIEKSFTGVVPLQYYTNNNSFDPNSVILLVDNQVNSGYAAGNNVGLRIGYDLGFEYLMVLNNDTLFKDNSLGELVANVKDNVLCAGPLLLKGDGSIDYNCAKRRLRYSDLFILSYFGRWLKTDKWVNNFYYLKKYPALKEVIEVDIISGSCMLFRAKLFHEIGFFDEKTFLYYEEAILTEKARPKNYKFKLVPGSVVVHLGAQTTAQHSYSDFILRCEYDSAMYYLTRWRNLSVFSAKVICFSQLLFLNLYRIKMKLVKTT